jgi:hypothetical protein
MNRFPSNKGDTMGKLQQEALISALPFDVVNGIIIEYFNHYSPQHFSVEMVDEYDESNIRYHLSKLPWGDLGIISIRKYTTSSLIIHAEVNGYIQLETDSFRDYDLTDLFPEFNNGLPHIDNKILDDFLAYKKFINVKLDKYDNVQLFYESWLKVVENCSKLIIYKRDIIMSGIYSNIEEEVTKTDRIEKIVNELNNIKTNNPLKTSPNNSNNDQSSSGKLPNRDSSIIFLWNNGFSAKEIASEFKLSARTIEIKISELRKLYGEEMVIKKHNYPKNPTDSE